MDNAFLDAVKKPGQDAWSIEDVLDTSGAKIGTNNDYPDYQYHRRFPKKPAEARSAPAGVFPDPLWWEEHGVKNPDILRRYGETQAALAGLIDGLGFGLPSALLQRASPDAARVVDDIRANNNAFSTGGAILGTIASPGQKMMRALGDKIMAKGTSTLHQGAAAAADGLTNAAAYSVPGIIKDGDPNLTMVGETAPVQSAMRWIMPMLPPALRHRIVGGAVAGAMTGVPDLFFQGDLSGAIGKTALGAAQGAISRGKKDPDVDMHTPINRAMDLAWLTSIPAAGATLYSLANAFSDSEPKRPERERAYQGGHSEY